MQHNNYKEFVHPAQDQTTAKINLRKQTERGKRLGEVMNNNKKLRNMN